MILPLVVGLAAGTLGIVMMYRFGLLVERSGTVVLVCAVAFFYPVFAVAYDSGAIAFLVQFTIFVGFCAAAIRGFRSGTAVLAGLLVVHGLYDGLALLIGIPAPLWWPAFCAGVDVSLGAGLFWLLLRKEIPA